MEILENGLSKKHSLPHMDHYFDYFCHINLSKINWDEAQRVKVATCAPVDCMCAVSQLLNNVDQ